MKILYCALLSTISLHAMNDSASTGKTIRDFLKKIEEEGTKEHQSPGFNPKRQLNQKINTYPKLDGPYTYPPQNKTPDSTPDIDSTPPKGSTPSKDTSSFKDKSILAPQNKTIIKNKYPQKARTSLPGFVGVNSVSEPTLGIGLVADPRTNDLCLGLSVSIPLGRESGNIHKRRITEAMKQEQYAHTLSNVERLTALVKEGHHELKPELQKQKNLLVR